MLLRRISQHIKEQNWFAVFLDFFIVVVGVFIGIQVANWNAKQGDIKLARVSIAHVQQELSSNRELLELWIDVYQTLKNHAERTLHGLSRPVEERGVRFLSDAYQATSFAQFSHPRTAYDDFLSLGVPKTFIDQNIRQNLARYYLFLDANSANLHQVPAYRSHVRSIIPFDVQTLLRAPCRPQINIFELKMSLAKECQPDLSEDQLDRGLKGLSSVDLKPDLNMALSDLTLKIAILRIVLNASKELDELIENNK